MSEKSEAIRHIIATIFSAQNALRSLAPEFKWTGLGNLLGDFNNHATWNDGMGGTIGMSSGKWYWEVRWIGGNYYSIFGVIDQEMTNYKPFSFIMGISMAKWPDFEYHVGK